MKIDIIGAGAMGCLYGAYLSLKHEVTMLDCYESQVQSINECGINVFELEGKQKVFKNVKACLSGIKKKYQIL